MTNPTTEAEAALHAIAEVRIKAAIAAHRALSAASYVQLSVFNPAPDVRALALAKGAPWKPYSSVAGIAAPASGGTIELHLDGVYVTVHDIADPRAIGVENVEASAIGVKFDIVIPPAEQTYDTSGTEEVDQRPTFPAGDERTGDEDVPW